MQSRTTAVIHLLENFSLPFVLRHVFELVTLLSYISFFFFLPSSCAVFRACFSERSCALLQCFYKDCFQPKRQMAYSLLMHSVHCGSAVFSYEALGIRPAQETLISFAGLHNKNFKGNEHSPLYLFRLSIILCFNSPI
jgi:hypothetical protein